MEIRPLSHTEFAEMSLASGYGTQRLRTRAKIVARIDRLSAGNFGDFKTLRGGLFEMPGSTGTGYRFILRNGRKVASAACGGDKRKQSSDISARSNTSRTIGEKHNET